MINKQISILGCGWLGLPLAKAFIAKGYKVKGSTTSEDKFDILASEGIKPFVFNLNDTNNDAIFYEFLNDSAIVIINFPPKRIPNIEAIYKAQLESILPFISETQKIIFVSSTSVYQNTNGIVTETLSVQPEKASGKAVLAAETLLFEYFKETATVVRFAGLIGPDRFPGRFLAGKNNLPNAEAPVNIIHRTDCINLIAKIINKNCWGHIINGCADEHPTREEYYTKAAKAIDLEPPTFLKSDAISFKTISNNKSKTLLDFTYRFPNPMDLL